MWLKEVELIMAVVKGLTRACAVFAPASIPLTYHSVAGFHSKFQETKMSLEENFNTAAEDVKVLKGTPDDQELLEIYALYKQGTIGDCNTSKPGMFDFKGKAKWEAWNAKKGTSQDTAKESYIEKVKVLIEKYGKK